MSKVVGRLTTRKQRRERQRRNYLEGRARQPYAHTPAMNVALEENGHESSTNEGVCRRCRPILTRYIDDFKELTHRGSALKRRKRISPVPRSPDREHYRDVKKQNDWIRQNMFDAMGNYLYCSPCIVNAFGVSGQRLARQRNVVRKRATQPIVEMKKSAVEEQSLGSFVVMPAECNQSFMTWWRSLESETVVEVRYPYERHGLSAKTSNSAKVNVMKEFISFVDAVSQPNGRSEKSHGPTSYFLSKFTTVQMPKKNVANYEEKLRRSVVGEFNQCQREAGKGVCSNGSASNWLRKHRPKVSICPHKLDYCDACARLKERMRASQTTLNRLKQTGSSTPEELQSLESQIQMTQQELEEHKQEAAKSHKYYKEMVERCSKQWKTIQNLEEKTVLSVKEESELTNLKTTFTMTIDADYQMSKLIPYWGYSPQPASTYYMQKLSHDILGIVNHATGLSTIYVFDERLSPKNTDHTISYITDFLLNEEQVPHWVRRVHIFLDNASNTNKNAYVVAWALEMVQHKKFDIIRISFMIAGHTKFGPDLLFSKISQAYRTSDVFTTDELCHIAEPYASVIVDDGHIVRDWRGALSKYTKLPGVRSLHDFVCARRPRTGNAHVRVRNVCYEGSIRDAPIKVSRGHLPSENAIPGEEASYLSGGLKKEVSATKQADLLTMYNSFIPYDRRPNFLPPL